MTPTATKRLLWIGYVILLVTLSGGWPRGLSAQAAALVAPAALAGASPISIDFETVADLADVGNRYASLGLTFEGARILTQGGSLNDVHFPPHSGRNVIYDDPSAAQAGTITVQFNQAVTGNVTTVGAYITGNTPITMTAYDANGTVLGSARTNGPNYLPVGTPNQLLEIHSVAAISRLVLRDSGNTFTVDDLYFDSEQACQVVGVPLYKQYRQTDEPWANDDYGGTTNQPWQDPDRPGQNAKIRDWGCAMTSAAMLISYYGQQQTGRTTTPRELNDWLKANNGYSGGNVIWAKMAEYARDGVGTSIVKGGGVAPHFYYYGNAGRNAGVVNGFVCNSAPVILNTTSAPYVAGHYLVATGQSGANAWAVNDPGGFNLTQLSTSALAAVHRYSDQERDPSQLYIAVHSPVELLITDPVGNRTGYDAATGQFVNEIIDATYAVETLGRSDGSGTSLTTRVFETGTPISGEYTIELIWTGTGPYTLDFLGYDQIGQATVTRIENYVSPDPFVTVTLTYSDTPGQPITVTQPLKPVNLPYLQR